MFPPKLKTIQRSLVEHEGAEFALVQGKAAQQLAVLAAPGAPILADLEGQTSDHEGKSLLQGPLSPRNAAALRTHLPWLQAQAPGPAAPPRAWATAWGWPRPATSGPCAPPAAASRPSSPSSPSAR